MDVKKEVLMLIGNDITLSLQSKWIASSLPYSYLYQRPVISLFLLLLFLL